MSKTYIANTILVGSKVESEISLFKDRFIDEDTFIYVCQNKWTLFNVSQELSPGIFI